jgi:hypothetical protein
MRALNAIGIGEPEPDEDLAFALLHDFRVRATLVVEPLRVQRAVDDEVRVVGVERDALRFGFALDDRRAEDEVGREHRLARVRKREDVGRVVLAAVVAVEREALVVATTRTVISARAARARHGSSARPRRAQGRRGGDRRRAAARGAAAARRR